MEEKHPVREFATDKLSRHALLIANLCCTCERNFVILARDTLRTSYIC